jgi:dephospho-CoA kinase
MVGVPGDPKKKATSSKPIIGLVGGIGAGKSLAAALFAERGAKVINADALGHAALTDPAIRSLVHERFGSAVLDSDGQVNRRKLGAVVFADPGQRTALQDIVFPWIDREIRVQMAQAETDPAVRLIVLDAAIMLETGWNNACRRVVYIDAPREQRLARLIKNRAWTAEELTAREHAQLSNEEKRARADDIIVNDGSPEDLARQIDRWFGANKVLLV